MEAFLRATEVIDWRDPAVLSRARELAAGAVSPEEVARRCFRWVRDSIEHSADFERGPVTCAASEVLREGTGYCYAKSHLLAALLRANGIPAGLCYQRLAVGENGPPYCLHGLNAVHLADFGWYRIDPRGNKPGVDAQFCPPLERLAFQVAHAEERDFREVLADPLPVVLRALRSFATWDDLGNHLPDWEQASPA